MATVHVLPLSALPENGTVRFEVGGTPYLVADIEGEVRAFAPTGPAAGATAPTLVDEGRLRCPLHGWLVDPDDGRCSAADLCRFRPLAVEVRGDEIRVTLA